MQLQISTTRAKSPPYITRRLVSLRAYDANHRMVRADVIDGGQAAGAAGVLR